MREVPLLLIGMMRARLHDKYWCKLHVKTSVR
jgi:hypothetical protein